MRRMTNALPPWLNILGAYLRDSSYSDLKLCSPHSAVAYNELGIEEVPRELFAAHFSSSEHYEEELTLLAWHLGMRFDAYHPFALHHHPQLGRITLISSALLPGCSQLFLRHLGAVDHGEFWDPHGCLAAFKDHFLQHPWLICGASGVGKSTLLAQQLGEHFQHQPVVIMDRHQEFLGEQPHWTYLREQSRQSNERGRVNSRHLLELAFKLGSGVLVFGEIRHQEIASFFHGVLSGHCHVYGTFHAHNTEALWQRMAAVNATMSVAMKSCVGALFLAKDQQGRHVVQDIYQPPL